MTTAEQVLAVARNELGNVEARDGSNKYGRAYGMDRVAWCMQFCWWVFREAGASDLIHPKTAYTPTAAQWHKDRGRFDQTPRVGDLVFFNWPDSVNRIQHVGIVEAVEPTAVITIEGNTSTTNQSDGGRVMRRRRARNSSIVGYGHPNYTATAAASGGDWSDMATKDEIRAVIREELGRTIWETTGALPNRRGPNGEKSGSYADTLFGYTMTTEGNTHRTEMLLRQIAVRLGASTPSGPLALTDADRAAIAAEVAALLAARLAA